MRRAVRGEVKTAIAPALDVAPPEMRQAIPGVAHVPRVRLPDVVRDQKGRRSKTEIGEKRIDAVGERGVAVVKRQ